LPGPSRVGFTYRQPPPARPNDLPNAEGRKPNSSFPLPNHKNFGPSTAYGQNRLTFPLHTRPPSGTLLCSQSASLLSSAADRQFSVAGDSLEGESPGEFRFVSSELVPGRCGLLQIRLSGSVRDTRVRRPARQIEALNWQPGARASGVHRQTVFLEIVFSGSLL